MLISKMVLLRFAMGSFLYWSSLKIDDVINCLVISGNLGEIQATTSSKIDK